MPESDEWRDSVRRIENAIQEVRSEVVRRDVYEANRVADAARFAAIERDVIAVEVKTDKTEERRSNDRKVWLTGLAFPLLLVIVQIYLASQVGK